MKIKSIENSYIETKSAREILKSSLVEGSTDVTASEEDATWLENGSTILRCKGDSFVTKVSKEIDESQLALSSITALFIKALVLWYVCGDRCAEIFSYIYTHVKSVIKLSYFIY